MKRIILLIIGATMLFCYYSVEGLDSKVWLDFLQSKPWFACPWDDVGFLGNYHGQLWVLLHLFEGPDSPWRILVRTYQLVN